MKITSKTMSTKENKKCGFITYHYGQGYSTTCSNFEPCTVHSTPEKKGESWEEEFDIKWGKCGAGLFEPAFPKDIASKERIKQFISALLESERREIVEIVTNLQQNPERLADNPREVVHVFNEGYQAALSRVISLIKK
jgi:hypothetical protein